MAKTDEAVECHGTSFVPEKMGNLKSNFSEVGGGLRKRKERRFQSIWPGGGGSCGGRFRKGLTKEGRVVDTRGRERAQAGGGEGVRTAGAACCKARAREKLTFEDLGICGTDRRARICPTVSGTHPWEFYEPPFPQHGEWLGGRQDWMPGHPCRSHFNSPRLI